MNNDIQDIYELTPLQQGMLFHTLYTPESSSYNVQLCSHLKGKLDEGAFQKSWALLLERYIVLRTSFVWERIEKPYQVVHRNAEMEIQKHDWRALSCDDQKQHIDTFIEQDRNAQFDLTKAPLMRLTLLRLDETHYQMIWTFHHIILEGWSIAILLSEFWKVYDALRLNRMPDLLQVQPYTHYINWLKQQDESKAKAYWSDKLSNINGPCHLPFDKNNASEVSNVVKADTCSLLLNEELTAVLSQFARKNRITMNTIVQGMWSIIMSRYTGESDIIYGVAVSGRPPELTGSDTMVGLFVNTLPVRVQVTQDAQLVPWLRSIQLDQVTMREYEYSSLMQVKKWGGLPGGQPLFNTMLGYENWSGELPVGQLTADLEITESGTYHLSDQPLTLFVGAGRQISFNLMYDIQRFCKDDIERMLVHCQNLLEVMVEDKAQTLSELSIMSASETRQLYIDWNQTKTDYPSGQTVHQLFEQQVLLNPDATAVVYQGKALSYTELNQQANQLAHFLNAKGVKPEALVGICLERSLEMIVALLGILKAGGAYLPLDPDYPNSRLEFMLDDAQVSILLTTSLLQEVIPSFPGEVICLDTESAIIGSHKTDNLMCETRPGNLVYVIYTSGSTGHPKGTLIEHKSVVRLVKETNYVELGPEEVFLQFAPVSFDASTFELWGSLLNGSKLVIFPAGHFDLKVLAQFIQDNKITTLWLTSSLFSQMVDNHLDSLTGVRQLLTGGEALSLPHVNKMLDHLSDGRLINGYGPTENTTFTCCHVMSRESNLDSTVPIGRPISNTTVYILDEFMNLSPIGVPGELYIGGDGLARGYLNQKALTAEKFVPNPFTNKLSDKGGKEEVLYRTGDWVRYRNDGSIEFFGRIDHQLKIRGYRVEPGEIETVLIQQEAVHSAVVIVREDEPGNKFLAAYVVLDGTTDLVKKNQDSELISILREEIRHQLPEYMVPSVFVVVDEFPLNANGKLDRHALPIPGDERINLGVEYIAPRSEYEQQLAQIWAEILKLEKVGIHDNFFDIGGHSLMATQVISRIREQLNVDMPLSRMFSFPTVADFTPQLEDLIQQTKEAESLKIKRVSRQSGLKLSFAQERLWFLDQLEPGNPAYIIPMALRLKGQLRESALINSLNAIVRRHEALRTRFVNGQSEPVQVIDEGVKLELQKIDLSDQSSDIRQHKLATYLQTEAIKPFELSTDLLIRGSLLRLGDKEHVLVLTMHHIISDGWSLGVLFRELGTCYAAYSNDQLPELSELAIQYADFSAWQRDWLSGTQLDKQLSYWKKQLDGLQTLSLPVDYPRPPMQSYTGSHQMLSMSSELTEQLKTLSQQSGVTLFMTLLAAYSVMLHRYSGQDDVVIGSPIANRNRSELEGLIAFFVNMLVMRIDSSGNPGFKTLLKRVSSTVLGAFEHQDIPFEKLVEVLQVERDPSRNPLFQVHFALQNAPMEVLELKDLTLESVDTEAQVTRFDLECHIWEQEDGLEIAFIYNTDLFDESTIQRMLGHYQIILSSLAINPDQPIDQLPILSQHENQCMLEQWNQTDTCYELETTIQQLFEDQVDKTPSTIAIEISDKTFSYIELDERANQLAHYLREQGVGADTLVGIFMDRSLDMVVSIYAILKAGGAYVPLDPEYPQDRINYMLADTQVAVLLTQQNVLNRLPTTHATVVCVDSQWASISELSKTRPTVESTSRDLAYVIFTSGSTGRPKGVMNEQRGVVNRLFWMQQAYPLTTDDRVLQKTPFSFDVSVWEFFWPLINGARLVLAEPEGHKDPIYLSDVINAKKITTLHFVPSMLKVFLDMMEPQKFASVKRVICSGEALPYGLQQQFFSVSDAELHNLYGPTEAAVDVSSWACRRNDSRQLVPIGRPISNTRLYILDRQMQPVPIGVSGELHIGGIQLARGYLGQKALTDEKFIANPFSDDPESKLYKTGDLVRYLEDGAIDYIGRIDNQIKLRGQRIELGEIEADLTRLDIVKNSVVVAREDEPGDQKLVAYVVADSVNSKQLFNSHSDDHVDEWQTLYEETYRNTESFEDATFNIISWNSSYTGAPIPAEEMREWVDETVARIAEFKPQAVLEIGCGTGLILYRLSPECQRYVGADFSSVAQNQVKQVGEQHADLKHVELWQRTADDFSNIDAGEFDMVVINSVVQYFPSMEYLVEVLTGAVEVVAAGGQVFVGDVRSLALLKSYHASVDLFRQQQDISGVELLRIVQQHVEEENELVIEPVFFHVLKQKIPRLSGVEILLKRGKHQNELSAYRYDVILHVEADEAVLPAPGQWYDWGVSEFKEPQLRDKLMIQKPNWLGISGLPNARVIRDIAMLDELETERASLALAELKQSFEVTDLEQVNPVALWELAEETGYHLELSYTGSGSQGRMDALFRRSSRQDCSGLIFWPQEKSVTHQPWNQYSTNPLKGKLGRAIIPQLKEELKIRLPDYMVPSVFVMLDELPMTSSGKVDRRALPVPGNIRIGLETEYQAPRNELEEKLTNIWADVLKLERVGVNDDFFNLGGHSLMATQVITRLRKQMNVNLPLSDMFGYPTIAELSKKIEMIYWASQEADEELDERDLFEI